MNSDWLKNYENAHGDRPSQEAAYSQDSISGGNAPEDPGPAGGTRFSRAPVEERADSRVVVREVTYEKPAGVAREAGEIRVRFEPLRVVVVFDASGAQRRFASEIARAINEIKAAVDGVMKNAVAGLDRRASVRGTV
jgi:hypothetical protein